MPVVIDNGSTDKIVLYCVLSSDHITPATGKTVAVAISKDGAIFSNPSGGATNATEIGHGWYYFTPSSTDTGTNGPLIVLGTEASIDDSTRDFLVRPALGPSTGGVNVVQIDSQTASASGTVTFPAATLASTTNITAGTITTVSGNVTGTVGGMTAAGFAEFFTTDSGKVYTDAVSGSVVKEIASNSGSGTVNANVVSINSVTTSGVTTIGANIGTTQPINFQGSGASAMVKSDVEQIRGVNSVGTAGYIGIDWAQVLNKTSTVALTNTTIAAVTLTAASVSAVWDEINTGATHNINSSTGKQLRSIATNTTAIRTGTAQVGGASTITLDSGASSVDQTYQWTEVSILSGTGSGQSRVITNYVGSTKVATVDSAWTTPPDATSGFEITPTATARVLDKTGFSLAASQTFSTTGSVGSVTGDIGGNLTGSIGSLATQAKTDVTNAVLEVSAAAHDNSGTIGQAINQAASAGDPLASAVPGDYVAGTAGYILGNNLDATVSSRLAPTNTGRTLDISINGNAGIDWANIDSPMSTVDLSGTTIAEAQNVTNVLGDVAGSVSSVTTSVPLDLTVAVPISNTANTIGDCLNAARAGAFGDIVVDSGTKTLTMKAANGSTVHTFGLDSVTAPKTRTTQ